MKPDRAKIAGIVAADVGVMAVVETAAVVAVVMAVAAADAIIHLAGRRRRVNSEW
jgi:hypothetical protein